jgi:DNA-binding transcriptional ArsR family regulator
MTASGATVLAARRRASSSRHGLRETERVRSLAEIFKVLGDDTRLRICLTLSRQELCVGDIARVIGISESAVSHQLRLMKVLRLVKYRREGRMTYYMLDDQHIEDLIRIGVHHVEEGREG